MKNLNAHVRFCLLLFSLIQLTYTTTDLQKENERWLAFQEDPIEQEDNPTAAEDDVSQPQPIGEDADDEPEASENDDEAENETDDGVD